MYKDKRAEGTISLTFKWWVQEEESSSEVQEGGKEDKEDPR